jgi:hypothetical protein
MMKKKAKSWWIGPALLLTTSLGRAGGVASGFRAAARYRRQVKSKTY